MEENIKGKKNKSPSKSSVKSVLPAEPNLLNVCPGENENNENAHKDPMNNIIKKNRDTLNKFNTQMSMTLCDNIAHINNICMNVRSCLADIKQSDERYSMMKNLDIPTQDISCIMPVKFHEQDSNMTISLNAASSENLTSVRSDILYESPRPKSAIDNTKKPKIINLKAKSTTVAKFMQKRGIEYAAAEKIGSISMASISSNPDKSEKQRATTAKKIVPTNQKKLMPNPEDDILNSCAKNDVPVSLVTKRKQSLIKMLHTKTMSMKERSQVISNLKKQMYYLKAKNEYLRRLKQNIIELPKKKGSTQQMIKPKRHEAAINADKRFIDSLWFAPKTKEMPVNHKKKTKVLQEVVQTKMERKPAHNSDGKGISSSVAASVIKQNEISIRAKIEQIQCIRDANIDSLDTLRKEDLEPIASEYPRRDHLITIGQTTKMQDTFLYNLTYHSNDQLMQFLLALPKKSKQEAVPPKSSKACNQQKARRREAILAKLRPLLAEFKLHHHMHDPDSSKQELNTKNPTEATKSPAKAKESNLPEPMIKPLLPFLVDPTMQHFKSYTVMPVSVVYHNRTETKPETITNLKKFLQDPDAAHNQYTHLVKNIRSAQPKVDSRSTITPKKPQALSQKTIRSHKYRKCTSENLVNYVTKQQPMDERYTKIHSTVPHDIDARITSSKIGTGITNSTASKMLSSATAKLLKKAKSKVADMAADLAPVTIPTNSIDGKLHEITMRNKKLLERDIQRVVNAIEQKIVRILSEPTKENPNAFTEVEKEIKDILVTMKRMKDNFTQDVTEKMRPKLATVPSSDVSEKSSNASVNVKDRILKSKSSDCVQNKKTKKLKHKTNNNKASTEVDLKKKLNKDSNNTLKDINSKIMDSKGDDTPNASVAHSTPSVPKIAETSENVIKPVVHLPHTDDVINKKSEEAQNFCEEMIKQIEETNAELKELESQENDIVSKMSTGSDLKIQEEQPPAIEEENKVVAKQSQHDNLTAINSGSFLTPYFQAIKEYRKSPPSGTTSNMLDFLDQLNNVMGNVSVVLESKQVIIATLTLRKAAVVYSARIYWPIVYKLSDYNNDAHAEVSDAESEVQMSCKDRSAEFLKIQNSEKFLYPIQTDSEDIPIQARGSSIYELPDAMEIIENFERIYEKYNNEQTAVAKIPVGEEIGTQVEPAELSQKRVADEETKIGDKEEVQCTKTLSARPKPISKCIYTVEQVENNVHGDAEVAAVCKYETTPYKHPENLVDIEAANLAELSEEYDEYGAVLSAVYGIVFSVMYMGLNMNFSCS